jgi:P27 family predicted phage terminase small subunit
VSRPSANPVGHPRTAVSKAPKPVIPVVSNAPIPPAGFDNEAVALWDTLWRLGVGVYAEAHIQTITRYVELTQERRRFRAIIADEGWMVVGSQGQSVLHPIARQLRDVERQMLSLEDRLGLSPEASLRLGLATAEVKSKLDAFLEATGN